MGLTVEIRRQIESELREQILKTTGRLDALPLLYATMAIGKESKGLNVFNECSKDYQIEKWSWTSDLAIDFWIAQQAFKVGLKSVPANELDQIMSTGHKIAIEALDKHLRMDVHEISLNIRIKNYQLVTGQDPYIIAKEFTSKVFGFDHQFNALLVARFATECFPFLISNIDMMCQMDKLLAPKKPSVISRALNLFTRGNQYG